MPRTGRLAAAPLAQEPLHHAVLERVERDHCQPTSGLEHALGRSQPFREFIELAVEVNADRLKGPGGGVLLVVMLMV